MMYRIVAKLVDSSGSPLEGKNIDIYIDGIKTFTGATDSNGEVSTTYDLSPGTHTVRAVFTGDDVYEGSEVSTTVSVGQQPQQPQSPQCSPVFTTGIDVLDRVLFCVGGYGVTVAVIIATVIFIILLMY
jgi:hypothetical protein